MQKKFKTNACHNLVLSNPNTMQISQRESFFWLTGFELKGRQECHDKIPIYL